MGRHIYDFKRFTRMNDLIDFLNINEITVGNIVTIYEDDSFITLIYQKYVR